MSSYLHALTSLCNKVHVQCHSKFIVLEEKETVYVRDTIKKPVKNLTFGKGLEKGISGLVLVSKFAVIFELPQTKI